MGTITNTNSAFRLIPAAGSIAASLLPALAGVGFEVQGFASDDAFATDSVDTVEARKGVDNRASFGYLPRLTKQTVTLMADSPSIPLFETLIGAQDAIREVITLNGTLSLPSVGRNYVLANGALTRITPIAPGKRVLESSTYEITWDLCTSSPTL